LRARVRANANTRAQRDTVAHCYRYADQHADNNGYAEAHCDCGKIHFFAFSPRQHMGRNTHLS
jgi:hypothetical protein